MYDVQYEKAKRMITIQTVNWVSIRIVEALKRIDLVRDGLINVNIIHQRYSNMISRYFYVVRSFRGKSLFCLVSKATSYEAA